MELKSYLQVLIRRWPAVVLLPLLVGALAIYQDTNRVTQYTAHARVSVVRMPDQGPAEDFRYDDYYTYLTSEFKIDDLVETVGGNVFASAVAERSTAAGVPVDAATMEQILSSDRQHRILSVMATTTEPERSLQIAQAAVAELEENANTYLDMPEDATGAIVRVVDYPNEASTDTTRSRIILLLGAIVAFGAGVLLAFLVDYLDDTLYDAESVSAVTRLPVLTSVPEDRS